MSSHTSRYDALRHYDPTDEMYRLLARCCAEREVYRMLRLESGWHVSMMGRWRYIRGFRTYMMQIQNPRIIWHLPVDVAVADEMVTVYIPPGRSACIIAAHEDVQPSDTLTDRFLAVSVQPVAMTSQNLLLMQFAAGQPLPETTTDKGRDSEQPPERRATRQLQLD